MKVLTKLEDGSLLIPLKRKYRTPKAGRSGPYKVRTGIKSRPGYQKHKYRGNSRIKYGLS